MTSIRRRILLPLLPLLALALLVTAFAIYGAVRRDLRAGLDRTLTVLASGVGSAVDVKLGGVFEFEREEVTALGFPPQGGEAFYVVRDEQGGLVAASTSPPADPTLDAQNEKGFAWGRMGDRAYRVYRTTAVRLPDVDDEDRSQWRAAHPGEPVPVPRARRLQVMVGHTTTKLDAALRALSTRLAIGFGALFLVLGLLPIWIVSHALRSLSDISEEADRVGPHDPDRRLPEAGAACEVLPLVAALNRALDRLGEAYVRQKRFTADAAHELRTPLSALRARCEVALRKPRSAEELREDLGAVLRTTLRLADLVEHLLALARLQGELSFPEGSADLARAAREGARMQQAAALAKGITLEVAVPAALPLPGNEPLLTELVSNLVENAVRYTPAGGTVTVVGGAEPAPWVAVEDTGIGVSEEHRERIFDRFYRVDPARSRADGGVGLGLAIASEIARLHRAELTFEGRETGGSRFILRCPPRPAATKPMPAASQLENSLGLTDG